MKKLVMSMCGAALLAAGTFCNIANATFSENFESLNAGVTIDGQNGWFVQNATNINALVVNNPAVAFEGSQYLSLQGGPRGDPNGGPTNARHLLGGMPIDEVNSNFLFSYTVRFEAEGNFGFYNYWNANSGSSLMLESFFNANGEIFYVTNGFDNVFVDTGFAINTGAWYRVSYRAFPSSKTIDFSVRLASDNSLVMDQIIPMNTTVTPTTSYDIQFKVDNNQGSNHWLVDDISIVPEPSIGLLGTASVLGWLALRRRR